MRHVFANALFAGASIALTVGIVVGPAASATANPVGTLTQRIAG